ncbi:uncharacterized protein LOC121510773 [Cheilinus undulatus]|uniref:uncharacterized protein LOC121510773 n=1 Tax=Cheilinus undulatus TaxID=241271 RepID=UPI001BD5F20A|nr:uncharacterized protein LOC121510773 [Cheilinus undulatus]
MAFLISCLLIFTGLTVKTNQQNSAKFSISDDKKQRVFTVSIKDLTRTDAGYYWCNVEKNRGGDDGARFYLSVTDHPKLSVDNQNITAYEGDNVTIKCFSHYSGGKKWCQLVGSCVTSSSGWIGRTRVTITAMSSELFSVTMSGLSIKSSGWYLCAKGDIQMPVHINVTERPTTNPTSTPPNRQHSPALEKSLVPLSLLIFIMIVTLVTWFLLKRQKKAEAESAAATTEEEITYSTVTMRSKPTRQIEADADVTYSSVVISGKTKG